MFCAVCLTYFFGVFCCEGAQWESCPRRGAEEAGVLVAVAVCVGGGGGLRGVAAPHVRVRVCECVRGRAEAVQARRASRVVGSVARAQRVPNSS